MATQTYNGWSNYETWNVALWIDNEEGSYGYWRDCAQECYDNSEADKNVTRKENAACDLAEMLKNEFDEQMPEVSGCYADLLNAALSEVDWYEIAEHLLSEVDEEESTDDE